VRRATRLGAAGLGALVLLAAAPARPQHSAAAGSGAVGLDVYAQGATLDLLVADSSGGAYTLQHRRSRDGGLNWSEPVSVPLGGGGIHSPHRGADPQIAAQGDRVIVLWTRPGTSKFGSGPLASALSADGGRTWRAGGNPADDASTDGHGYADLVADAAGRFHAVWLDSRDGGQGLRSARSADGGETWAANTTLDGRTCECCWNKLLAVGRQGVRVIYRDKDPRDLAVAGSDDGGRRWSRLGTAGVFNWRFEGCPHVGGALAATSARRMHALVWTGQEEQAGLHLVTSSDGGRKWGPALRVGSGRAHHADLAAVGSRLAAVWDEPEANGRIVQAAFSDDGGRTWSSPRRVSDLAWTASFPLVAGNGHGFVAFWTEAQGEGAARWRSLVLPTATTPQSHRVTETRQ
jgi:hypothetical protein